MRHDFTFGFGRSMPLTAFVWGFFVFPNGTRRPYVTLRLWQFRTRDGLLHFGRLLWSWPFWWRLSIRSTPYQSIPRGAPRTL